MGGPGAPKRGPGGSQSKNETKEEREEKRKEKIKKKEKGKKKKDPSQLIHVRSRIGRVGGERGPELNGCRGARYS